VNYINFFFEETNIFEFPEEIIKDQILKIISDVSKYCGEISVIFCKDEYLLNLNKKFLKHDYYTDIITFNYSEGDHIGGDLFISVERVLDNAVKFEVSFIYELARVIFHGVLHLIGYGDNTDEEKFKMRKMEDRYLNGAKLLIVD